MKRTKKHRRVKGEMSFLDAAFKLIYQEGHPMHYVNIMKESLKFRMVKTSGQTPAQSLLSAINKEIKVKGSKSRFVSIGRGIYGLSRCGKRWAKKEF